MSTPVEHASVAELHARLARGQETERARARAVMYEVLGNALDRGERRVHFARLHAALAAELRASGAWEVAEENGAHVVALRDDAHV